ncbi:MAG: (2Fe-2S)-binding protein [Bdellovibrionaceae bacterium]|nr:(2Fe-2S)-binding protein [Pseudobdellovibrionaceae bacterium]
MKVKFVPQNIECEILPGQSVLHVAQDNNIHIKSVCRGVPSCAECRVKIIEGEYNVIPPSSQELSLIGTAWFVDRRRLSCQLRCFGDITVDLTEQVERESAGKKPRGKYNKDEMQESRAVLGNLVMSDEEKSDALRDDEDSKVETGPVGADRHESEGHGGELDDDQQGTVNDDDGDDDGSDDSLDDGSDVNAVSSSGPRNGSAPLGGKKRRRRRGRRGKGRRGPPSGGG